MTWTKLRSQLCRRPQQPKMSKLTSQEVIDKGDYLEPNFDPTSLTVVHLRAVLLNHGVTFASSSNKGQLVQLFNTHIRANAPKLQKARTKTAAIPSDASDILDGETGEFLEVCGTVRLVVLSSICRVACTTTTLKKVIKRCGQNTVRL